MNQYINGLIIFSHLKEGHPLPNTLLAITAILILLHNLKQKLRFQVSLQKFHFRQ